MPSWVLPSEQLSNPWGLIRVAGALRLYFSDTWTVWTRFAMKLSELETVPWWMARLADTDGERQAWLTTWDITNSELASRVQDCLMELLGVKNVGQ